MLTKFLGVLVAGLLAPLPALAFGSCTDPAYLAIFGEPAGSADCDVRHEFIMTINGHPYPVRVISTGGRGDDAEWIAAMNDLLPTIALWAEAMGPGLLSEPVTMFLTDRTRRTATGPVRGARLAASLPGECDIAMYKMDEAPTVEEWNYTIAHEMFHCFQRATWPGQASAPSAAWWAEGSADYFASSVVPVITTQEAITEFGPRIAEGALYAPPMDYQTVVFFHHVAQRGGPEAVANLIAALPEDGDYLRNLQGQYGIGDWVGFAEAYLLGQVVDAAGNAIAAPTENPELFIPPGDSVEYALSTDAYRIYRATLRVPEGSSYDITVEGGADLRARVSLDGAAWTDLPQSVDACAGERSLLIYAVTTAGPQDFVLRASNSGSCSVCDTARAADACLVGTWLMTGGGPIEWMRAQGLQRRIRVQASEMSVRMFRNGDYVLNPVTAEAETTSDGTEITGTAQSAGISGTWGALDGVLYICPLSGETTATLRVGSGEPRAMLFGPGGDTLMEYQCSGNTLTTSLQIRRLPPMVSTYTRQGG